MYKLIVVAALFGATVAYAQPDGRPDPSDGGAGVPPVVYRSAFAEYQAHKDPEVANWRDINEAVRAAGGHVGLTTKPPAASNDANPARPAQQPEGEGKPAPGGHAGHH